MTSIRLSYDITGSITKCHNDRFRLITVLDVEIYSQANQPLFYFMLICHTILYTKLTQTDEIVKEKQNGQEE